jgi:hypothetical protein
MSSVTYKYGFPEHVPHQTFTTQELLEPVYDRFEGRITREAKEGLETLFNNLEVPSITRHYDQLADALDCIEDMDPSGNFTLSHALIIADAMEIPHVKENASQLMNQTVECETLDELIVPSDDVRSYTTTMLDSLEVTRPKHPFMDLSSDQQNLLLSLYDDAEKPFEDALAQAQMMAENTPLHKETQDIIEDTLLQGQSVLRKEDLIGLSELTL